MAENRPENPKPAAPRRRRKRTKWQNFKEAYLPAIIVLVAVVCIAVFISGAIKRNTEKPDASSEPSTSTQASDPTGNLLAQEEADLLAQAQILTDQLDYEGAMAVLNTYSAGISTNETLMAQYNAYQEAFSQLTPFSNIMSVPVLTFRHLIEDLNRALPDETYGDRYNQNYVTTSEFRKVLQQLYDQDYMLVSPYDVASVSTNQDGVTTMAQGTLYLPSGKKPMILVQTGVNYFTYIVDGDGDGLADANSDGFACKLVIENGELVNEMYDTQGNLTTGAYDLIPILNAFIDEHPDFSYRGAKATIALTGYDGLLGYRTDPETATKISQEFYQQQLEDVKPVIQKLRDDGFDIACYSYNFESYSSLSVSDIRADLQKWSDEVTPLLGDVDILVYAGGSDISSTGKSYTGEKYELLRDFGFSYFIGQDNATKSWGETTAEYTRLYSREVRGSLLHFRPEYYADLFDAAKVLDAGRSFDD